MGLEHIDVFIGIEAEGFGVAIALEQLLNPLLLGRYQQESSPLISEKGGTAAQIVYHIGTDGGDVFCQHLAEDVAEANSCPDFLDGTEVLAVALTKYRG